MEKYRNKIEEHGTTMENMGLTPVASRIYIYLMFRTKPGATFEEMVTYFSVSKSAVSNALKMLSSSDLVESKTIGGHRKRYFSVNFERTFNGKAMIKKFNVFNKLLKDIQQTKETDDDFVRELDEIIMLYQMLQVEIPIIIDRWKRTVVLKRANPNV